MICLIIKKNRQATVRHSTQPSTVQVHRLNLATRHALILTTSGTARYGPCLLRLQRCNGHVIVSDRKRDQMRDWRKLHRGHLSSSRIRGTSDEAFRLWAMLVTALDDDGFFPEDNGRLATLVGGTTRWHEEDWERILDELEAAQLVTRHDGFIELFKGMELNGPLKKDRKPFVYRTEDQRIATGHAVAASGSHLAGSGTPVPADDGHPKASGGPKEGRRKTEEGRLKKKKEEAAETNPAASASLTNESNESSEILLKQLTTACERDFGPVEPGLTRVLKKFADSHADLPLEWVEMAFDEAAKNSAGSWKYVATVLESWIERGQPGKPTKDKYRGKTGVRSRGTQSPNNPTGGFKPVEGPASRIR
jgi:hypothetical protein